jgi:hypothetical protein
MNLNPTEFIQASLNQKKGELENRRQDIHVVEGLLLRSRANWHENGEIINLRDSLHSWNDKFPSKEFFCSSLNLTSFWKKNSLSTHK